MLVSLEAEILDLMQYQTKAALQSQLVIDDIADRKQITLLDRIAEDGQPERGFEPHTT